MEPENSSSRIDGRGSVVTWERERAGRERKLGRQLLRAEQEREREKLSAR